MKKLSLVPLDHPALREKSKKVIVFDNSIKELVSQMLTIMSKEKGAGLAANQLGVTKRVIVVNVGNRALVLINPEIESVSEEQSQMFEGCLSFPKQFRLIERPKWCTVKFQSIEGKKMRITPTNPGVARCLIHECQHLDGELFIDYPDVREQKNESSRKGD